MDSKKGMGTIFVWLRRIVALVVLVAMIGLFVSPAAVLFGGLGWLPRIQLVPAVASGSVLVLAAIAVSVAFCGRLYCSVACPLGIAQDLFRGLAKLTPFRDVTRRPLPREMKIPPAASWFIRLSFLLAFVASAFAGLFAVLAPYGIFGRAVASVSGGEGAMLRIAAAGQLALILLATLWRGRFWCNAVCPVGTFLGAFSRFAVFRVRIDRTRCVNCNLCVRACSNGCISAGKDKKVDHSRCVTCLACADVCGRGALTWR